MSLAPKTLLDLQEYLALETGLSKISLGIVGNAKHKTGYHLGEDRLKRGDYSILTARDRAGLTLAASAIDIGNFKDLRAFSIWLVDQARANQVGTRDFREIIYSPDGKRVLRWDRERGIASIPREGEADQSHTTHSHISWYRDSEPDSKLYIFSQWFEKDKPVRAFDIPTDARAGIVEVIEAGHAYLDLEKDQLFPIKLPWVKSPAYGPLILTDTIDHRPGDTTRKIGYLVGTRCSFVLAIDSKFTPFTQPSGKELAKAHNIGVDDATHALTLLMDEAKLPV